MCKSFFKKGNSFEQKFDHLQQYSFIVFHVGYQSKLQMHGGHDYQIPSLSKKHPER